MTWEDGELLSLSGQPLYRDSEHSLSDGTLRYPMLAGIPYLRSNRDELRQRVLNLLDGGDEAQATCELLRDQDAWARAPAVDAADLEPVAHGQVSLHQAMRLLQWGPVADYFAYRWSDPTYLSGLALLDSSVEQGAKVFELACGVGHYCHELSSRGIDVMGGDVVFAKLYLARQYTCPRARLVCFDAAWSIPLQDSAAPTVFCHDAFYFLQNKSHVARELRRIAGRTGTLVIGHTHNAVAENFSAGDPLTIEEYRSMFSEATVFDDDDLTRAVIEARTPTPLNGGQVPAAISLVEEWCPRSHSCSFAMPKTGARLRLNPLFKKSGLGGLDPQSPGYPSKRYENEYGAGSWYLRVRDPISADEVGALESGNWHRSPQLANLVRRRIFLSVPERW